MRIVLATVFLVLNGSSPVPAEGVAADRFADQIAQILVGHCLRCHQGTNPKGDIDLSSASGLLAGEVIVPGKPEESLLFEVISGPKPTMPKSGDRLDASQVEAIRAWIADGAKWPEGRKLKPDPLDWWSLRPLVRPEVPRLVEAAKNPIDCFIRADLKAKGLTPSAEADRRTLIRRVTYDLTGLPPTPEEVESFERDDRPDAYERVVDRLLASPSLGERWGRHWLDVARYGDTHGYDKDQPRPNAWPYRDYVIRAFNEDKPYSRFVLEQVAGDVLFPGTRDGIEATGFIAAGPWDFIGHAEVPETKLDGQVARLLDRDDMVANTLNSFASLTVQCARCHDHKFDPVSQDDYYSLQAVFAALDRADRLYDADPAIASSDENGPAGMICLGPRINERVRVVVDRLSEVCAYSCRSACRPPTVGQGPRNQSHHSPVLQEGMLPLSSRELAGSTAQILSQSQKLILLWPSRAEHGSKAVHCWHRPRAFLSFLVRLRIFPHAQINPVD